MESFLNGVRAMRKSLKEAGKKQLADGELAIYAERYDAILSEGWEENKSTRGKTAKKEEQALLRRMEKYKENHLLFLKDFQIHYSNNMSEKYLRVCKNREKMAGGFRTDQEKQIYCDIMSFIETMKRRKGNIFQSIALLINNGPVPV